jgi:hypothetical protein
MAYLTGNIPVAATARWTAAWVAPICRSRSRISAERRRKHRPLPRPSATCGETRQLARGRCPARDISPSSGSTAPPRRQSTGVGSRATSKRSIESASALGHSRPGPAGRRSSHVRYAPKATFSHQNAIGRDGPTADIQLTTPSASDRRRGSPWPICRSRRQEICRIPKAIRRALCRRDRRISFSFRDRRAPH